MTRHLGRKPRAYDQRVPHYSSLVAGRHKMIAAPPAMVDRVSKMSANWGKMLNDRLSCCTASALGHAIQLTSFVSGKEITPADSAILALYEASCGYNPADPNTDQGGVEQDVLKYVATHGIPTGQTPVSVNGFVEVDPRQIMDLRRVIYECGFCYIGVSLPASWEDSDHWTAPAPSEPIAGGHAIILVGYDANYFYGISWGELVTIEITAILRCTDEAYAVMLSTWFERNGQTVAGLTPAELSNMMTSLTGA